MYASAKNRTQIYVEIELDPLKTGSVPHKSIKICDNLLQWFRFTFGQAKPLFRSITNKNWPIFNSNQSDGNQTEQMKL